MLVDTRWCVTRDTAVLRSSTGTAAVESFGMHLEVHGGAVDNVHMLGAMVSPRLYDGRGLLHPLIDYDINRDYINKSAGGAGSVPGRASR